MTSTTPLVYDSDEISLRTFFSFFEKPSVFGLDCVFRSKNKKILSKYSPTLSSMYVEINTSSNMSDQVNSSFSSISSRMTNDMNKTTSGLRQQNSHVNINTPNFETLTHHSNSTAETLLHIEDENFLFEQLKKSDNSVSVISFEEDKVLYNRDIMSQKLEELFKNHPDLENATIGDISENSYFSILWTPTKSSNFFQNNTSFLVYYKFRNKHLSYSIKFLPVMGVVSNKTDDEFWFSNNIFADTVLFNEVIVNKLTEDFVKNRFQYHQYSESLLKLITLKKIGNIDYNFLTK